MTGRRRTGGAWLAAWLLACAFSGVAHAKGPPGAAETNDPSDEGITERLRAEAPDQVDAWAAANALVRKSPYEGVAALLAVGAKTARFSAAHRRACNVAVALEHREEAVGYCETAVQRERSSWNLAALAVALAMHGAETSALDAKRAELLITEALAARDADAETLARSCEVLAYRDIAKAAACANEIPDAQPGQKKTALAAIITAGLEHRQLDQAASAAATLSRLLPNDPEAWRGVANVARLQQDAVSLRAAGTHLAACSDQPGEAWLVTSLASAMEGNLRQAQRDAAEAERAGLPAEQMAALRSVLAKMPRPVADRPALPEVELPGLAWGKRFGWLLVGWLFALGLLSVIGDSLSRRVLRELARGGDRSATPNDSERRLRRAYGHVIWLAGIFFYASLPLVAVSAVGSFGVLAHAHYAGNLVPLHVVAGAGIVVLGTLAALVGGLFTTRDEPDPGTPLVLTEHPRLSKVLRQVAEEVGTLPIDRVFVTPGTDLAVFERGTVGSALRSRSTRCLVLGLGVLEGLDETAFRALLAHEHGHFAHGDTAGGELALSVRRSLLQMAIGMIASGAATTYNPAWRFVEGYHRLFLRISHGASRLQEVQADRFAAACYGPAAFERGLTHVITRAVFFPANAEAVVAECALAAMIFTNIYRQSPHETLPAAGLGQRVTEALTLAPSEDDSHPAPQERFALVKTVVQRPRSGDQAVADDALAWDLFEHREALELAMTEQFRLALGERGQRLLRPEAGSRGPSRQPALPPAPP